MGTTGPQSLLADRVHRFATLWRIERTDGVTLLFTDHQVPLTYNNEVYTPVGGLNASAKQQQSGLRAQNLEVVGMVTSDAITNDDLRAGRYRQAKVVEILVDWMYPFAGAISVTNYWIQETQFSSNIWEASVGGPGVQLSRNVGDTYTRYCRHDLGNSQCAVDLDALTVTGEVVAVTSRRDFKVDTTGDDDEYKFGVITFTSGANNGLRGELKSYTGATGRVITQLQFPFDIQVGDEYSMTPGCDKNYTTCRDKYDNVINFGGFPYIPGTNKMYATPDPK